MIHDGMPYKIVNRKSRLWKYWRVLFPGADMNNVVITFGKRIFMPPGSDGISPDLHVHELIHLQQQGFSYWKACIHALRYFFSASFRYRVELEAFRAQWRWYEQTQNGDYIKKYQYRKYLAKILSGPMYGKIVTESEAFEALGKKEN